MKTAIAGGVRSETATVVTCNAHFCREYDIAAVSFHHSVSAQHHIRLGDGLAIKTAIFKVISALLISALTAGGAMVGASPAFAAIAVIEGRVVDASGKPVQGIVLSLDSLCRDYSNFGSYVTDAKGRYSLTAQADRTCTLFFEDRYGLSRPIPGDPGGGYEIIREPGSYAPHRSTTFNASPLAITTLDDVVLTTDGIKEVVSAPKPLVAGTPEVGGRLIALTPDWMPGMTKSYYWYRDGQRITSWMESASSITVSAADAGHRITVAVHGYSYGYKYSKTEQSDPVTPPSLNFEVAADPTISGTTRVGSPLTAVPGTWSAKPSKYAYQWFRSDTKIAGAVARTYTPTNFDENKRLTVTVTGTALGYNASTATSKPTAAIGKGVLRAATPTIGGTKKVGHTLTVSPGTWTTGTTFRYQWYRGGSPIKGAISKTYKVAPQDLEKTIKIRLVGSRVGYAETTQYSASTPAISKGTLTTKTPTLSGTKKVGSRLSANPGVWTPGTALKYQWYRSGKPIKGATNRTYMLTASDKSRSIKVRVVGSKAGYSSGTRFSTSFRMM